MTPIKQSEAGMCADFTSCYPTWQKKPIKLKWLKDKKLYLGETTAGQIVCLHVYVATDMYKRMFMMDAVTGSLYRENGSCCTSDYLKLLSYAPASGLDKRLANVKNTKTFGGM